MHRVLALTLTCAVLAGTAAACGQSASSGDGDPAALVPAGAGVYAQLALRPEGRRRDDALAAAGKILRTDDPAGRLRELVDKALAGEHRGLTWDKDVAPWLGEQAGIWATDLNAEGTSFAAILETIDAEAAAAALQRFKDPDVAYAKRSHAGVDYEVHPDGIAGGLVDDFLVVGTEDAFKRTADVAQGGDALSGSDRYANAMDDLEGDRLGQFYIDVKVLVDAALEQDPASAPELAQFKAFFPFDKLGPVAGSFQADGAGLAVDSVMSGLPEGPLRAMSEVFSGGGSELTSELPGDAWGALTLPELGDGARRLVSSFAGALGGAAASAEVKRATGLDLEQDVFSWIGDVGMYVRGTSEPELDGALVIQSTDDEKASAAFGKIIALIAEEAGTRPEPIELAGAESAFSVKEPDAKQPIVLARGSGRVVAAYGEDAAKSALDPATRLGDSELYGDAKDALPDGMEPGLLLSVPAILDLVDAIGAADVDYAESDAKPYLETLGAIATGGKVDGGTARSRIAVTLK